MLLTVTTRPAGAQRPPKKSPPLTYQAAPVGEKSLRAKAWDVLTTNPFASDGNGQHRTPAPRIDELSLNRPGTPPTPAMLVSLARIAESQGAAPQARTHLEKAGRSEEHTSELQSRT